MNKENSVVKLRFILQNLMYYLNANINSQIVNEYGISLNLMQLCCLYEINKGVTSHKNLIYKFYESKDNLSYSISKLWEKGLINYYQSENDKRVRLLITTDKGKKVCKYFDKITKEIFCNDFTEIEKVMSTIENMELCLEK